MITGFSISETKDGAFRVDLEEDARDVLGWDKFASFDDAIRAIRRHWFAEREGGDPPPL